MLSAGTLLSLFQGSDTAAPVRGTAAGQQAEQCRAKGQGLCG